GVLAVDPVPDASQPHQVVQVLRRCGAGGHRSILPRAPYRGRTRHARAYAPSHPPAVMASSSTRSWASRVHEPAATLARTWSGVRAPALTEATAGWAARPEIATVSRSTPRSRPNAVRASTLSKSAPASRSGKRVIRVPAGGGSPRRYLPVSRPEA